MAKTTDFESFEDDQDFDDLVEADSPEEEEEEETPVPVPVQVQAPPIKKQVPQVPVVKKTVVPKRIVQPVEEEPEETIPIQVPKRKEKQQPAARYVAYKTEKRYGLIDNLTGQPIAESADAEALTLTILSDILNKLDRIESSL